MPWLISFIELLLCLKMYFFYSIQLSMLKSISTLNVKFLRFQLAKLSISEETNEKEIHFTQTVCNIQLRRQILVFCRLHKHSILVALSKSRLIPQRFNFSWERKEEHFLQFIFCVIGVRFIQRNHTEWQWLSSFFCRDERWPVFRELIRSSKTIFGHLATVTRWRPAQML